MLVLKTPLSLMWIENHVLRVDLSDLGVGLQNPQFKHFVNFELNLRFIMLRLFLRVDFGLLGSSCVVLYTLGALEEVGLVWVMFEKVLVNFSGHSCYYVRLAFECQILVFK